MPDKKPGDGHLPKVAELRGWAPKPVFLTLHDRPHGDILAHLAGRAGEPWRATQGPSSSPRRGEGGAPRPPLPGRRPLGFALTSMVLLHSSFKTPWLFPALHPDPMTVGEGSSSASKLLC